MNLSKISGKREGDPFPSKEGVMQMLQEKSKDLSVKRQDGIFFFPGGLPIDL